MGGARERVKRYLVQRFYTRFHMSLILMSAGFAAMLTNWTLLHWGVTKMWMRYPVAVTFSYLTFLAGVWLWIQYVNFRNDDSRKASVADGLDIPNIGSGGGGGGGSSIEMPNVLRAGGGSFDGGGAGGSWVEGEAVPMQAFAGNPAPSGGGGLKEMFSGLGDIGDLDGEAVVIIVLAVLLIFSILIVSGYVIWFAPDILSEAVFGATLAGTLARTAKNNDEAGWVLGVVKKTWWPFAIVFVVAMAFAIYAAIHYPNAVTFGGALQAAIAG